MGQEGTIVSVVIAAATTLAAVIGILWKDRLSLEAKLEKRLDEYHEETEARLMACEEGRRKCEEDRTELHSQLMDVKMRLAVVERSQTQ